jgi:prepilin-type N-terminal cleavage/methylation domain-containing protein
MSGARNRTRRANAGFTLIEVLAAFAISLFLLVPLALIISAAVQTQAAAGRGAALAALRGEAARVAAARETLQPGQFVDGQFVLTVSPDTTVEPDPGVAFRLMRVRVATSAAPDVTLAEILRLVPQ